jgi:hypothetical protein
MAKIKDPAPYILGLRPIAKHMGWTVKALLWRTEHERFPLQTTFYKARGHFGFQYVVYLAAIEKWHTAQRKAALKIIKSRIGYHAKNYTTGKRTPGRYKLIID